MVSEQTMDMKDLFETKAKGRSDGKAKEKILVLIPEMTFVSVDSRVLILETTFVGVESRVLIPETTFVGVESMVLILETNVWDTLVYPSDTLVILTEEFRQRMMADALEKVAKASIGAQSTSERTSARSKLRAERAAVHKQRALEKAVSQKTVVVYILATKVITFSSILAKALAEKEKRDLLAVKEQAERNRLAENLDADIKRWSNGKEKNLRLVSFLAKLYEVLYCNLETKLGEMLVVCDYSANHLLGQLLSHHSHQSSQVLEWNHRYNIVKSLACAIRYLHEELEEQVIHKNITSSAIFIDPDMNPRLGSFALAEFLARNEHGPHVVVDKRVYVHGIFGYMEPEYMEAGEATPMADVYSFGVVMLEVVSGQMAVEFRNPEVLLVKRVHGLVKLAMACTQSNLDLRPTMSKVVSILDGHDRCFTEDGQKE
ncbi:receptor like protein kinase S.2-like protein [Tanacetum coccineum]